MSSPAWLNLREGTRGHWRFHSLVSRRAEGETLLSQSKHRNLLQPNDAQRVTAPADQRCRASANPNDAGNIEANKSRCECDQRLHRTSEAVSESAASSCQRFDRCQRLGEELATRNDERAALQIGKRDEVIPF